MNQILNPLKVYKHPTITNPIRIQILTPLTSLTAAVVAIPIPTTIIPNQVIVLWDVPYVVIVITGKKSDNNGVVGNTYDNMRNIQDGTYHTMTHHTSSSSSSAPSSSQSKSDNNNNNNKRNHGVMTMSERFSDYGNNGKKSKR